MLELVPKYSHQRSLKINTFRQTQAANFPFAEAGTKLCLKILIN